MSSLAQQDISTDRPLPLFHPAPPVPIPFPRLAQDPHRRPGLPPSFSSWRRWRRRCYGKCRQRTLPFMQEGWEARSKAFFDELRAKEKVGGVAVPGMEGDTGRDVSRRVKTGALWDRDSPDGNSLAVLGTGTTEPRGGADLRGA